VIDNFGNGDRLIVIELSRLGCSILEMMKMLSVSRQRGIRNYAAKGPVKSKLDLYDEGIVALLNNGSTKSYVAKQYGTTLTSLYNHLKNREI
jgi:DNA invertase Pin-like site-specific DNA recombinase